MKRFAWWLFGLLMYTCLASTGEFNQGGGWPWYATPLGVLVLIWPLLLPLIEGYCAKPRERTR